MSRFPSEAPSQFSFDQLDRGAVHRTIIGEDAISIVGLKSDQLSIVWVLLAALYKRTVSLLKSSITYDIDISMLSNLGLFLAFQMFHSTNEGIINISHPLRDLLEPFIYQELSK